LRSSLINQGVVEGSEAFDRAMNRSDEQATDARMQTILAGGQEQSRLAGLSQAQAGFQNNARSQYLNEAEGGRAARINEIAALLGGSQVRAPNFVTPNPAGLANVDQAGLTNANYQQRLAAWQQRQQMMGGVLGTAASALAGF
jgi:hypothetical protein